MCVYCNWNRAEHGHHGHSHGNGLGRNHSRLSELANTDEADDNNEFTFEKQVITNQSLVNYIVCEFFTIIELIAINFN